MMQIMETTASAADGLAASDSASALRAPARGQRAGDNLKSVLIGVHCTPKLVGQIEKFISQLEYDEMSRPEAIRLILKRYFKDAGIE